MALSSRSWLSCYLLVIALILRLGISDPMNLPPLDSPLSKVNTTGEERAISLAAGNAANAIPLCADQNEDWQPPNQFSLHDCTIALDELSNLYVKGQETLPYEYLNRTTEPVRKGLHKTRLPLKLQISTSAERAAISQMKCAGVDSKTIADTCTIALVMRVDFEGGELPHEEHRAQSASSDVSNFGKLAAVAQEVKEACVKAKALPGWAAEGEHNSFLLENRYCCSADSMVIEWKQVI